MRPVGRAVWVREVLRSGTLTPATKLVMVALAQKMRADGRVSYPQHQLALDLGHLPNASGDVPTRPVSRAMQSAYEAGYLVQLSRGYEGHTAEYQAELPDRVGPQPTRDHGRQRVSLSDTLSGHKRVTIQSTLSTSPEGVAQRHPISKNYRASQQGEHVAVDVTRHWRATHDDSRDPGRRLAQPRPTTTRCQPSHFIALLSPTDAHATCEAHPASHPSRQPPPTTPPRPHEYQGATRDPDLQPLRRPHRTDQPAPPRLLQPQLPRERPHPARDAAQASPRATHRQVDARARDGRMECPVSTTRQGARPRGARPQTRCRQAALEHPARESGGAQRPPTNGFPIRCGASHLHVCGLRHVVGTAGGGAA